MTTPDSMVSSSLNISLSEAADLFSDVSPFPSAESQTLCRFWGGVFLQVEDVTSTAWNNQNSYIFWFVCFLFWTVLLCNLSWSQIQDPPVSAFRVLDCRYIRLRLAALPDRCIQKNDAISFSHSTPEYLGQTHDKTH